MKIPIGISKSRETLKLLEQRRGKHLFLKPSALRLVPVGGGGCCARVQALVQQRHDDCPAGYRRQGRHGWGEVERAQPRYGLGGVLEHVSIAPQCPRLGVEHKQQVAIERQAFEEPDAGPRVDAGRSGLPLTCLAPGQDRWHWH